MGDQRQLFRFRLPWLSAAAAPRPVAAPRPAAEPQPRPAPQTQAPSQPAITIPIQRPPIRPAGIAPIQTAPTPAQAPPQKIEPPQPVPSSRGTIQTQAPTPSRIAALQPQSTMPAVSKQQSPPRFAPRPAGQASSQPSSPPRRAIQVQTLSPPKSSAMATQVGSQPPSSIQPLSSASREPTFKPFGVAVKPSEPLAQLKEAAPVSAAVMETPSAPVKPKEMEERKKVAEERRKAREAGTKTREPLGAAMETGKRHLEKQEDSERKKTLTTSSTDEKQIKTVSATYPKDQKLVNSKEQVPLHQEIREDISKFVHKLVTGQSKLQTDEKSVSVLTLAGENRGASFHFGSEPTKKDGLAHIPRGPDATSDGEGSSRGRKPKDSTTNENLAPRAYVNSNTQSVNNSVVLDSSLNGRNPGVHLDFFNNSAESIKSSAKAEPLKPRQLKHSSMAGKSKVLIIGGTGYIGKFIVEASAKEGHPTFALVRKSSVSDPVKGKLIENFKNLGVQLLYGDLHDHESLVKAIKQVDVVISAVGQTQLADQVKIIAAIKEAGNVKRFFPSEFGNDVDRVHAVEPAKSAFATKVQIRRAIEAEGIPYTYVSSNCFAGYFLPNLSQPGATAPPRDKVVILGDGNPKAVFNYEGDIGTYTIKAVDDPRTLNKILYIRPPKNIYSFNEVVALWEKLIGKTLEKTYVPEDQLLKQIQEAPTPMNVVLAISHSIFVKGDHSNFEIDPSFGVEASELYPDVKYTTVEEYLSRFV